MEDNRLHRLVYPVQRKLAVPRGLTEPRHTLRLSSSPHRLTCQKTRRGLSARAASEEEEKWKMTVRVVDS